MKKENYEYKKKIHICISCSEKALPGKMYCAYHEAKRQEVFRRQYERIKARREADPEYDAMVREEKKFRDKKYRERKKEAGICQKCSLPATHGSLCEKHWQHSIERSAVHPYSRIIPTKKNLPIPEIKIGSHVDVGKLISLYNAGWFIKDIVKEMDIPRSTAYYWINKAKEEAENEREDKRTQEVS